MSKNLPAITPELLPPESPAERVAALRRQANTQQARLDAARQREPDPEAPYGRDSTGVPYAYFSMSGPLPRTRAARKTAAAVLADGIRHVLRGQRERLRRERGEAEEQIGAPPKALPSPKT